MKNKIFLTSMLAMFVACPGVAAGGYGVNGNGDGYIEPETNSTPCEANPLTEDGISHDNGTFTLTAGWELDQCEIILDYNSAHGGASASNPSKLWTIYGNTSASGAYLTAARPTNKLMKPYVNASNQGQNGLLSAPVGQEVAALWFFIPVLNPVTQEEYKLEPLENTVSRRAFSGFTTNPTGGQRVIWGGNSYRLTPAGDTIAKGLARDDITGKCPITTWYAQWDCADVKPQKLGDELLPGYTFDNWYWNEQLGSEPLNEEGEQICSDTKFFGRFVPNEYMVEYVCLDGYEIVKQSDSVVEVTEYSAIEPVVYDEQYAWWDPSKTCVLENHTCTAWKCFRKDNSEPVDLTDGFWQIDDDVVCESICGANTVYLHWETEGNNNYWNSSCEYGANLYDIPRTPIRHGYTFTGWVISDWTEDTPSGN